jgi:hypothetical protein
MNRRFTVAEMNCESGVFRLTTTLKGPLALTELMLLPAPVRPTRSMILSCRPARKLYTTSAESSRWPSDHLALRARFSVSLLLPLLHFQERASHGTGFRPPWPVTMRGSKNAPWTKAPLGSPVAV